MNYSPMIIIKKRTMGLKGWTHYAFSMIRIRLTNENRIGNVVFEQSEL